MVCIPHVTSNLIQVPISTQELCVKQELVISQTIEYTQQNISVSRKGRTWTWGLGEAAQKFEKNGAVKMWKETENEWVGWSW